MKTIGWVKMRSRRYGGVAYEEKAMEVLKDYFDLEYIKVDSKIFKRGYLRAPELFFNLLRLKGKKDLWVRDSNTVVTASFDRTKGRKIAVVHHIDYSVSRILFKPIDFIIERLTYWSLKKMEAVVTVSEYWKKRLLGKGCSNVFVIYNSFDLGEFDVSEKEAEEFKRKHGLTEKPIVYIGNRQRAKGVVETCRVLKDLDVYLVTSGEKMVDVPTLNLNLEYRDYLKLLKASSIVLTMSKFDEGWCRTAHEAMLLRRPVIGSGRGGMRELLKGGGQMICENFGSLREKVEHLLNQPEVGEKMGETGYNFARTFSAERFRKDWLELINKLIY